MSQVTANKVAFTGEVAAQLKGLINEYDGNEVFAIGTCEPDGTVTAIEALAFGNADSVPAPAQNAHPGQVLIHNHPSGGLEPSRADISIASMYGKAGIGFYITNNSCDAIRVVVKPFFPKQAVPVEFSELENLFGQSGHLSKTFPNFEFRSQQLSMMKVITEAFNNDQVAVIEAGTGTGKSFAYLAPSILWALNNKRRVVISTNTINLQEQLLKKDLPELARQMGREFKAVLVKGRGNYLSFRRLKYAAGRPDLFQDDKTSEMNMLNEWAEKSDEGSRSDLPFQVSHDSWEAVMSDKDDCLRAECSFFNRCHFYKSRREAANADIIIANHHLVMADIALKMENQGNDYTGILPPFDRVVFDEAHNLEEVATSYFTSTTSQLAIRRQLFRIARPRDKAGVLQTFHTALKRHQMAMRYPAVAEALQLMTERILPTREEVELAIASYFDDFFIESTRFFHADSMKDNERRDHRISTTVTESPYWDTVRHLLESLIKDLHRLVDLFDKLDTLLTSIPPEVMDDLAEPRLRLYSAVKKISDHMGSLRLFLSADKDEYCRWLELGYRRGHPYITPYTAPLDISPALRDSLFLKKNTVILTSATLTIDNNFTYFTRQMGLKAPASGKQQENSSAPDPLEARTRFLQLDTPFDYSRNCIIGVPRDLPVPSHPDFYRQTVPAIIEAVKITQGRAMVLFTAYRPLRQVVDMCRGPLAQAGISCLTQGEQPRHQLVQAFRSSKKAALFATSSFWEGVDIQGEALQCLILTKLPFSVPSTPVLEARAEMIDRRGGNSFYEISVPQAVIKFKQGFGRLIRSRSDRGFVLVLDQRVLTQRYGKMFLKSLPPARLLEGTSEEVINSVRTFMGNELSLEY